MPTYDQTPGELGLKFSRGNDFSALIDTSLDMTGYVVTATLVSAVTGLDVTPLTVTVPAAAEGQVNIALTNAQTSALARGTYSWNLTWVDANGTLTGLKGFVEAI